MFYSAYMIVVPTSTVLVTIIDVHPSGSCSWMDDDKDFCCHEVIIMLLRRRKEAEDNNKDGRRKGLL